MISDDELRELERRVDEALRTGDESGLAVIGYGEITTVVGWPSAQPRVACKRLPPFPDAAALASYRSTLDDYLAVLAERGVDVVDTELRTVEQPGGALVAYCVQPMLDPQTLVPQVLDAAHPDDEHRALVGIVDAVRAAVDRRVGLDAQVSNWAWDGERLRYLDVTTPLLRDDAGNLRLDVALFLAAMPKPLRAPVARFVVPGIIDRFTDPRAVLLDMLANLHKERLARWLPSALLTANTHITPPISPEEVRRAYASDARLWRVLLAVRRADRWWQRHVRRRTYPFLLPGPIER